MFKKFNKLSSNRGQIAVILIVIIAIALIFYAVSLNLGRIAQTKTQITIAANSGAGVLASQMASYGQQIFMVSLGGKFRQCRLTITGLIALLIAAIVIAYLTGGALAPSLLQIIIASIVAVTAITIDQVFIQPGLNNMFNKHIAINLDQASAFLESGIRTALQTAISDDKRVLDEFDGDNDGLFGETGGVPNDEISRFGVYYLERLRSIQGPDTSIFQAYIDALSELLYQGNDDWGLYDPVRDDYGCLYDDNLGNQVPTPCNQCCLPETVVNPDTTTSLIRETCCNPPCTTTACNEWPPCGVFATCGAYNLALPGLSQFNTYPLDYDPYYENPANNAAGGFVSFREQIGRDDEHPDFVKKVFQSPPLPQSIEQDSLVGTGFIIEDTTGYLNFSPLFGGSGFGSSGPDPRPGVYPFFYKLRDWGYDLTSTNPLDVTANPDHCFWYDQNYEPACSPFVPYTPDFFAVELTQRPLSLPLDPATLIVNTTPYVDPPGSILAPDAVTMPGYIFAEDDVCAQTVLYPNFLADEGFWKPGGDRYCSTAWPYHQQCAKHGTWGSPNPGPCQDDDGIDNGENVHRDCGCGETAGGTTLSASPGDPTLWPDDALDDIVYLLPDFFEYAEGIIPISIDTLARTFIEWYPETAEWIEPGTYRGASQASSSLPCYICEQLDGFLWRWLDNLIHMRDRFQRMLDESHAVSNCTDAWCGPEATVSCPTIMPDEGPFIGTATLDDIVSCLYFNETGIDRATGLPVNNYDGGNDVRFQTCFDACYAAAGPTADRFPLGTAAAFNYSNEKCGSQTYNTYLPRTLLPGFDPNAEFIAADMSNLAPYFSCPDYCYGATGDDVTPNPGSCLGICEANFNNCKTTCDTSLATCLASCAGQPPTCIPGCNDAYNICMNGPLPPPDQDKPCNIQRPICRGDCECPLDVVYECDQPMIDLLTALNNYVEPQGWKGTCTLDQFPVAQGGPGGNVFYENVQNSALEAQNQIAKFGQRRIFLEARLDEINFIIGVLDEAITRLDDFLKGPAADLIRERINWNDERLPYQGIYGWQGEPPPRGDPPRGLWHLVKVEARIPGRCDDSCDSSQSASQQWPRMRSYKRALGLQRCYELVDTEGTVKIRVTRYDEQKPSSALFFPNGVRIWDFRNHPDRDPQNFAGNIDQVCPPLPYGGGIYDGAFLANGPDKDGNPWPTSVLADRNPLCWDEANRLLTDYGVVSETCAKYYYQDGDRAGFDFQFIPCQTF